jgi:hypothetical protein
VTEPAGRFIAWYRTAEQLQVAPPGAESPSGGQGVLLHLTESVTQTWRSNKLWIPWLMWVA